MPDEQMLPRLRSSSIFQIMQFVRWPRRVLVVGGLLLSSFVELLGLTMVLPLLSVAVRPDYMAHGFGEFVGEQLQLLGLPPTLEALLGLFVALLFLKA